MRLVEMVPDDTGTCIPPDGCRKDFAYSDGVEIEETLLAAVMRASDRSSCSTELKASIVDWPTRYHLSPSRSNLLRPLAEIRADAKVLELGCGCGALTRYLGETCRHVDAVEGSAKRARIARERCKDLENVQVYAADFLDLEFDPQYDVVTLIGVLEYAAVYSTGKPVSRDDPFLAVLRLARSALKDGGVLVLAIENQIGLKYWAGCNEDHTALIFHGIHGYPRDGADKPGPETFSRRALGDLLRKAGLACADFYFPLPDYKLPHSVIADGEAVRDGNLYLHNWWATGFDDFREQRAYLFSEPLVSRTICRAGLMGEMANSFLVVASAKDLHRHGVAGARTGAEGSRWIAKRYSTERRPCYSTETTMYEAGGEVRVSKRLLRSSPGPGNGSGFRVKELDDSWQPGDLLLYRFYEAFMDRKDIVARLLSEMGSLNELLISWKGTGTMDEEGYPLVHGSAFDFGPWNIVVFDGEYVPIDDEWESDGEFAADYIMYRCMHNVLFWMQGYLAANGQMSSGPEALGLTILELLRALYPDYDEARHSKNVILEQKMQQCLHGLREWDQADTTADREGEGPRRNNMHTLVQAPGAAG